MIKSKKMMLLLLMGMLVLAFSLPALSAPNIPQGTETLYVSVSRGSNRNTGTLEKPYKDLQKAVDDAAEGAVILVAEGNYQGRLDAGYISIKKYVSILGGFNDDFSQRDPIKYKTMIRPEPAASGTSSSYGLLDIYVRGKRDGIVLIDGLILDKGDMNCYFIPNVCSNLKVPQIIIEKYPTLKYTSTCNIGINT